ncbi:hypothetical protein [Faecalibacterium sp.]|uniref:hypothetical protein n=1 Tax=Faecalibacterium sp. TaxID=1971605 RepID=UPI003A8E4AF9
MKKFGTRLISAVLAGCMMTSVLPVSAFALEGSTEFERTVSAQENSDAPAETSGKGYLLPTDSATTINKDFIADHGKVYSMSGTYTEGIVIDAEDDDVVINVTGETTFDKKDGNKKDCANFITVRRAKSVTVNAEGQTIKTAEGRGFIRCFYAEDSFTGTAVLNGGTYNVPCDDIAACYLCGGDWTFENLTMNAVLRAIETDKGANVIVNGGSYDCSESFSATFWINDSPSSSFNYVKATGVGWVMNAMNSQVNIVGGSYSRTYKDLPRYKDRPTLRVANNATLNVTDAEVTGTYCDVFVTGATANLVGGTYTNTNQYLNLGYESPALKVWNGGTLSVNGATVDCTGGNAAISSGEPAGSDYDDQAGGKLVVDNCTIQNSKYGIYLGKGENASAELKSATFENNDSDIYLASNKKITISDTFTTKATIIKVADPKEGRQLTVAGNANKLNLVSQDGYRVAYDKAQHYYYLTQRAPGYTLTAKDATATIKVGGVDTKVDPNDEIYEGTPVTLTADPAPDGQKFAGWAGIVILNGVVQNEMNDLLSFPNEEDHTTANFEMPKGDVTVRAVYKAVDPVEPPVDPVEPVDPVDPVLPGVIIGGAVILGAYETGTGIYRLMNMQGLPLPSDRIELAELVWERAGKPEPQNMTDENLYADIDADDTDAQKAAHWMVEQELMKFDEDNNKFHPCFPVSKLRVCLTWQNAKDKGLID